MEEYRSFIWKKKNKNNSSSTAPLQLLFQPLELNYSSSPNVFYSIQKGKQHTQQQTGNRDQNEKGEQQFGPCFKCGYFEHRQKDCPLFF